MKMLFVTLKVQLHYFTESAKQQNKKANKQA